REEKKEPCHRIDRSEVPGKSCLQKKKLGGIDLGSIESVGEDGDVSEWGGE
ncbi:hypothetical protein KI387_026568, partial [Taxus chinensis]